MHLRCLGFALVLACSSTPAQNPAPQYPGPAPAQPSGHTGYYPAPQAYPQQAAPQANYPQAAPQANYPQAAPQANYPQAAPQANYPQANPAGAPALQPTIAAGSALPAAILPAANDPINELDLPWLRARAQTLLGMLIGALPASSQAYVLDVPLLVDATVGEVNAYAGCESGRSFMAITDSLLEIAAWLSMTAASDERFGGDRTGAYIAHVVSGRRENQPLPRPGADFFPASIRNDGQKIARQHVLFDEQVAFVLGHELAHHHLGHLPCTAKPGPFGAGEVARALSFRVPLLNQPNESAADVAGTNNLLSAGRSQTATPWTETGALLTLRFFDAVSGLAGADLIFAFQRSHPLPRIRMPIIQQSAHAWRATGGVGLPVPRLGG